MRRKLRLGLALGSGSARGWAHIGVIRALEERGIKPDIVCGTSIGALVGGAYAAGELDRLEEWVTGIAWTTVVRLMDLTWRGGLIRGTRLFTLFGTMLADREIDELPIPYGAIATELQSGRELWLRHGKLLEAVRASCAMPGLLHAGGARRRGAGRRRAGEPGAGVDVPRARRRPGGRGRPELGQARALPAQQGARGGAARGAELDRTARRPSGLQTQGEAEDPSIVKQEEEPSIPSIFNVFMTSLDIVEMRVARSRLAGEPADVLITPLLPDFATMDFHRAKEAIEEGRAAVERMGPLLKQVLN